jgi:aminobutyraldehyde dehydrogenase
MLYSAADAIEANLDELGQIESEDCGKPLRHFRQVEGPAIVDPLRYYAGVARAPLGVAAAEFEAGHTRFMRRDPIGVSALLTAWNYPLLMATSKLAPALASGNPCIIKPSALTPRSTQRLAQILEGIVPYGALEVVCGDESVEQQLASHTEVQLISATGSSALARSVICASAGNLKRVHLDLRGRSSVLIFDDSDLELAVAAIRHSAYANSGQDRTAACRIFAQRGVYDATVRALATAVTTMRRGPLDDQATELGPVISAEHRERVHGFVQRAAAQSHMEIVSGGNPVDGPGFWYHPTLIAHARTDDEVVREEVFGPVVTITRFVDPEHALAMANRVGPGPTASLWTSDLSVAVRLGRKLRYDRVQVNQHRVGTPLSPLALDDYTVARYVTLRHD